MTTQVVFVLQAIPEFWEVEFSSANISVVERSNGSPIWFFSYVHLLAVCVSDSIRYSFVHELLVIVNSKFFPHQRHASSTRCTIHGKHTIIPTTQSSSHHQSTTLQKDQQKSLLHMMLNFLFNKKNE